MPKLRSLLTLTATLVFALLVTAAPAGATPVEAICSQPSSNGNSPVASDCLFILKVAVGLETCSPECICAPKGTLPTSASDALLCLKSAVGQPVELDCPCDDGGGGGGPLDPTELLGIVTATRNTTIQPGPVFLTVPSPNGVVQQPTETMDLGAQFGIIDELPIPPDAMITIEEIAGCTVITFEQTLEFGGFGIIPDFTPLDPGSPGTADNGSVEIDMISTGMGGFEPNANPLNEGYNGGQTITFSWPGGTDINAFSGAITVPGEVDLLTPDLTDPGFDLIAGQALNVSWVPDPDDDGMITVTASTSINETVFDMGSGSVSISVTSITVSCEFSDTGGSGTMPAAAMSELHSSAPLTAAFTKTLGATRANTKLLEVTPSVDGRDTVGFFATSSAQWATTSGSPLP
jgi:hypothetical protein